MLVLGEPASPVAFGTALLIVGGTYFLIERKRSETSTPHHLPLLAALGAGVLWGFASAVPAEYCLANGMTPMTYHLLFTAAAGLMRGLINLPRLVNERFI